MRKSSKPSFRWRSGAAALALAAAAFPAAAHAAEQRVAVDIKAGPLEGALVAYSLQTHRQLLYSPDVVAGRRAPAVQGLLTPEQALQQLLRDAPISYKTDGGVVTLKARSLAISTLAVAGQAQESFGIPLADPPAAALSTPLEAAPALTDTPIVSAVVVTGTNLRGVQSSPSPVITVSRDAIDRSGYATVADAISALPQNFSGVSTPSTFLIGSDRLGTNNTSAEGINLRGLGANATLVLIDGKRMAGSGLQGDFADLSAIPTAAVDHVDVLLDGASAVYGPDLADEIISNCGVEIAFTPKELKIAQELSARLGDYTYEGRSRSRPSGLSSGRRSQTESDQRRPLMLPQELLQMPKSELLVLRGGIAPIKGKKILYYRDRVFAPRLLPAPTIARIDETQRQDERIQAIALEVASLRHSVEDIRSQVVERAMTADEMVGETPLGAETISLTLQHIDLEPPPADASDTHVRHFMRDYLARVSRPDNADDQDEALSESPPPPNLRGSYG